MSYLNQGSLSDEDLVDVKENVAALDNHAFDGQVLPNVLRFTDLKNVYSAREYIDESPFRKDGGLLVRVR